MIKASELRMLEVINVLDGRRLGSIKDVEIDPSNGHCQAVIIAGEGREVRFLSMFGRNEDYVLPWENVKKIGFDVILVELGRNPTSFE